MQFHEKMLITEKVIKEIQKGSFFNTLFINALGKPQKSRSFFSGLATKALPPPLSNLVAIAENGV